VSEETIYGDNKVTITTKRMIVGSTTYDLRNVTAVRLGHTAPPTTILICLMLFGIVLCGIGFGRPATFNPLPLGAVLIAVAAYLLAKHEPLYYVRLISSSGESHALRSTGRDYIEKVIVSVNEAMVRTAEYRARRRTFIEGGL
jgi:hypothetical protein